MSRATPANDQGEALRAITFASDESMVSLNGLFNRGYDAYRDEEEQRADDLLSDVERFGTSALKKHVREQSRDEPFVEDPGVLATLSSLAAVIVTRHEKLAATPAGRLVSVQHIKDLFVNTLALQLRAHGDLSIQVEVADRAYRKPIRDGEAIANHTCTGIKQMPELGDGHFVEIPLRAASRRCLVGEDEIETHLHNNNLYVPASDLDEKFDEVAGESFERLVDVQQSVLSDDQFAWLSERESELTEAIDRIFRAGRTEEIWKNWSPDKRRLKLFRKALSVSNDEDVDLGEYLTAEQIYHAVEEYEANRRWEQAIKASIQSSKSVGQMLGKCKDSPAVEQLEGSYRSLWRLSNRRGNSTAIHVSDLDDLFELPCMEKMRDRLMKKGPVRKDLFNLVRMTMWLPEYVDADVSKVISDLKPIFEQWPWYDPGTTEYQVAYEFQRDGRAFGPDDKPLPMGCENESMQRYCIGMDVCDYSIYGSLPFAEEMFDELESRDGPY